MTHRPSIQNTMILRTIALLAALCCAQHAIADEPEARLPSMWDGPHGWQLDDSSIQVNEGTQPAGAILIEQGVQLVRTGTLKREVGVKTPSGRVRIPEGTKAFATNITSASWHSLNPIEWCFVLPDGRDRNQSKAETVCISWHDQHRSRYHTDVDSGLFFLPRAARGWTTSEIPRVEEGPVDFGAPLTEQIRLVKLTDKDVTLETLLSDGTNVGGAKVTTREWSSSGTLTYFSGTHSVSLTKTADNQAVEVRRLPDTDDPPIQVTAYTLVVDLLVRTDGTVKEARVAQSGGKPKLDQAAVAHMEDSWKLVPGTDKKGQPKQMWTRMKVTYKPDETLKQPIFPDTQ